MSLPLKRYDVVINGTATTLQLSDEDAKLYGLAEPAAAEPAAKKAAKPPANKARTATANKKA